MLNTAKTSKKPEGFSFEIKGSVQGVFFRKYTQREATRLGLSGWVANTRRNTVIGQVWHYVDIQDDSNPSVFIQDQQEENQTRMNEYEINPKLQEMKHWLTSIGSPQCKIDHASIQPLPITDDTSKVKLFELYPCNIGFQVRPSYP